MLVILLWLAGAAPSAGEPEAPARKNQMTNWTVPHDVTGPRFFAVAKLSALPAELGHELDESACKRRLVDGFPCYAAYYLPDGRLESVHWSEGALDIEHHFEYSDTGVLRHPIVKGTTR
jgi:hypothetical protein